MSIETEPLLGGRYRLHEPIGYGGMGRVFRATDERLDRPVAVKLLDHQGTPDQDAEVAEARAAARLSHPGVVHVFDAGTYTSDAEDAEDVQDAKRDQGFIVMELVPGQTLREILRECGTLPASTAADYAAQIADALDAIPRLGMVHCDVKPLNVLVTPAGHTKLVDFGIARESAVIGDNRGSAAYVAPEQARGEPVDGRTDIYALGLVLYEMLVGATPFSGETTSDLVSKRLEANPPPLHSKNPKVPRDLEAITLRALARDRAERYATAADMRDALRAALDRATDATQPIPVPSGRAQLIRTPPAPGRVRRPLPTSSRTLSHRLTTYLPPALADPRARVAVAAAILLLCALSVVAWRATHPTTSGVPRLVGLQLSEVTPALEQAGIAPADVSVLTRPVEPEYVGKVVDQQPQPGLPLPPDTDGGLQIAVGVGP